MQSEGPSGGPPPDSPISDRPASRRPSAETPSPDGTGRALRSRVPVRALTLGVPEAHPVPWTALQAAADRLAAVSAEVGDAGYLVQTTRLSMRPLLMDMPPRGTAPADLSAYLSDLHEVLAGLGIEFCSIGPVPAALAPGNAEAVADVVAGMPELNWSVMVADAGGLPEWGAALAAGRVMERLAANSERGLANFNFAALACVAPGTPFFPAAYQGPGEDAALSVATQGAGTVARALARPAGMPATGAPHTAEAADAPGPAGPVAEAVTERIRDAVRQEAGPVARLVEATATEHGLAFAGIDVSPAPDVDDSIAGALEGAGLGPFGGPGSLALCAAVTSGLRSAGLPTCGYSGLMLPLMEDAVLAARWEEGRFGTDQLLAWSAVCGTGLDTVPVPGATTARQLALVVMDMASLAARYNKPLSARLMPVPGAGAGDRADFGSPYLVSTLVKALAPEL